MIIASFVPSGMSYLYFADRIIQLPVALIGTTLGTIVLPSLSKSLKNKKSLETHKTINHSLSFVAFLSLPATFGLFFMTEDIVRALFMRGNFDMKSVIETSRALCAMTLGLPAFILNRLLTTIFYSHGDTKTPMKIAILTMVTNATISLLLLSSIQHVGIAIASTISGWINVICFTYILTKREFTSVQKNVYIEFLKCLMASIMMLICLWSSKALMTKFGLHWEHLGFIPIITIILSATLIYFFTCFLFKSEILKSLFSKEKLHKFGVDKI